MSAAGNWNTTMNTPMGAQNGTMELTEDGGTLSGTLSTPQGSIDLEEGTIDGNNMAWKASISQPMAMTLEFTATLDGDNITGDAKLGSFGNASFTATRA